MAEAKKISLAGIQLPLDVNALEAVPAFSKRSVKFFFTYRHIRFAACFEDDGQHCHMKIVGDAGIMPFSAESPVARAHMTRILRAGGSRLGGALREVGGRIVVGRDIQMDRPITGVLVMTGLTRALLPLVPYLDLLSTYVRPPMEPSRAGERSIRPEWRPQRRR